jgi:hypothetical protein
MTDDPTNQRPHAGVMMTGADGPEGPKAFYILIEALPGGEEEVVRMLRDIRACVEDEPATGPWYAVRHSPTQFAIFEAFRTSPAATHTSREKAATSSATSSG